MHKIHVLTKDECELCCQTKFNIKSCPLEHCNYKICKACKKKLSNNLCPACRREVIFNEHVSVPVPVDEREPEFEDHSCEIYCNAFNAYIIMFCIKMLIVITILTCGYFLTICLFHDCDMRSTNQIIPYSLLGSFIITICICINTILINIVVIIYKSCKSIPSLYYNRIVSYVSSLTIHSHSISSISTIPETSIPETNIPETSMYNV